MKCILCGKLEQCVLFPYMNDIVVSVLSAFSSVLNSAPLVKLYMINWLISILSGSQLIGMFFNLFCLPNTSSAHLQQNIRMQEAYASIIISW